jgi:hypothetical protein
LSVKFGGEYFPIVAGYFLLLLACSLLWERLSSPTVGQINPSFSVHSNLTKIAFELLHPLGAMAIAYFIYQLV